ncbi:MAG: PD-(D/E)XK nuclease family protein [Oscillospiraceae bacterium]
MFAGAAALRSRPGPIRPARSGRRRRGRSMARSCTSPPRASMAGRMPLCTFSAVWPAGTGTQPAELTAGSTAVCARRAGACRAADGARGRVCRRAAQPGAELAQERMEQNAQTLLETFPDSGRTGYLLRRTFDEVTQVVDELYDELSVSAFRPKFCELEFSARGALPGVAFAGERCRGVVEGFVDRVDVWQSGGRAYVRVVDYKTGKKSFDYTNVLHGRGLQMLLYLFALVRQGGHLLHGEPLPAGVLYFPARIERVSVRDRLAQAEIEKERCKQLRAPACC